MDGEGPAQRLHPVAQPDQPGAARRVGAADAVVGHLDVQRAAALDDLDLQTRRLRVLAAHPERDAEVGDADRQLDRVPGLGQETIDGLRNVNDLRFSFQMINTVRGNEDAVVPQLTVTGLTAPFGGILTKSSRMHEVMRIVDAILAIPVIITALLAVVALGPSRRTLIVVIGFLFAPIIAAWNA